MGYDNAKSVNWAEEKREDDTTSEDILQMIRDRASGKQVTKPTNDLPPPEYGKVMSIDEESENILQKIRERKASEHKEKADSVKTTMTQKWLLDHLKRSRERGKIDCGLATSITNIVNSIGNNKRYCGYVFIGEMKEKAMDKLMKHWDVLTVREHNIFAVYSRSVRKVFDDFLKAKREDMDKANPLSPTCTGMRKEETMNQEHLEECLEESRWKGEPTMGLRIGIYNIIHTFSERQDYRGHKNLKEMRNVAFEYVIGKWDLRIELQHCIRHEYEKMTKFSFNHFLYAKKKEKATEKERKQEALFQSLTYPMDAVVPADTKQYVDSQITAYCEEDVYMTEIAALKDKIEKLKEENHLLRKNFGEQLREEHERAEAQYKQFRLQLDSLNEYIMKKTALSAPPSITMSAEDFGKCQANITKDSVVSLLAEPPHNVTEVTKKNHMAKLLSEPPQLGGDLDMELEIIKVDAKPQKIKGRWITKDENGTVIRDEPPSAYEPWKIEDVDDISLNDEDDYDRAMRIIE